MGEGEVQNLLFIIKVDVQGLQEVFVQLLFKLLIDEVCVQIVYSVVGGISENDVNFVMVLKVVIIGFNMCVDVQVCKLVEVNGIDICYYNIIYDVVDEVKVVMLGMLVLEKCEVIIGMVEVCQVFKVLKVGMVVGCMVMDGIVKCLLLVCVLCNNVVIFMGEFELLKCFKDDVKEVK